MCRQRSLQKNTRSVWDPGSKISGLAIVSESGEIVYAAEVHHRGGRQKGGISWGIDTTRRLSSWSPARAICGIAKHDGQIASEKVPVLTENGWEYRRGPPHLKGQITPNPKNDFNRVSTAKFLDKRYRWERLPRTKGNIRQKKRWRRSRIEHQRVAENGWVAPSLMSRVFNLETWTRRLCQVYPIVQLAIEHVKFDMQLMENPDIHGIEYQHGTLHGREIREYLLELTGRKCAYCGKGKQHLQVEHIVPESGSC